jgi:hypothetical protein
MMEAADAREVMRQALKEELEKAAGPCCGGKGGVK